MAAAGWRGALRRWLGREPALGPFAQAALASGRARELTERYPAVLSVRPVSERLGALFLLDLLEQIDRRSAALRSLPEPLELLEVGAKDLEAAPTLLAFFSAAGRRVRYTGVEVDPRWRRAGRAAAARLGEEHRALTQDVRRHPELHGLVVWLHPFLDLATQREWGLDPAHFAPGPTLAAVWSRVRPQGRLLVVNQTAAEASLQRGLFAEQGIAGVESFEVEPYFRAREEPAYVHLAARA